MTAFQQVLLIVIILICAYILIDRICKCIELCAKFKAYSKINENTTVTSPGKVQEVDE